MLTVDTLKRIDPGIFAKGIIKDVRLHRDFELKWVAVRGSGIHDWAIYYHKSEMSDLYVSKSGDKCFTKEVIRELVPCDNEAFAMYRF